MYGHHQNSDYPGIEQAVRTPAVDAGYLVYGFHESKGIVPLPASMSVKGEPHLGEQGLCLKSCPASDFMPATRSTSAKGRTLLRLYLIEIDSDRETTS